MKRMNKKKVAVGVGLGLAAAGAAAAAGYYFYGSKHAAGNRKKAAVWANKLKADVLKNAKKAKKLDERAYHAIVNEAMKAYQNVRSIDKSDLRSAAGELKANWKAVEREINRVGKKEGKVAKRAVRRAKRIIPRMLGKKKPARRGGKQ